MKKQKNNLDIKDVFVYNLEQEAKERKARGDMAFKIIKLLAITICVIMCVSIIGNIVLVLTIGFDFVLGDAIKVLLGIYSGSFMLLLGYLFRVS